MIQEYQIDLLTDVGSSRAALPRLSGGGGVSTEVSEQRMACHTPPPLVTWGSVDGGGMLRKDLSIAE